MTEKEIPFNKIEVGMELTSDVVNKYNKVLINANTRIEQRHKFLLKTWGIKSVKVQFEDNSETGMIITEEQKAQALIELKKRMQWEPRNEIESELVEIAIERICHTKLASK